MTTSAQLPDRTAAPPSLAERPTDGLNARHPFVVDTLMLLDHRTRERTLDLADARPGRYLSLEHEGSTRLIALERPITHIGRGLIADVRLDDAHVSRRHAILDDRSSNGTFVNGRSVMVSELADGDVLRFGRAVFRYTVIGPRARRPLRRIPVARGRRSTPQAA